MSLVLTAHFDDLVVNLRRGGTLGQYVFAANPLYRLAHHRRSTHINEDVTHLTD